MDTIRDVLGAQIQIEDLDAAIKCAEEFANYDLNGYYGGSSVTCQEYWKDMLAKLLAQKKDVDKS